MYPTFSCKGVPVELGLDGLGMRDVRRSSVFMTPAEVAGEDGAIVQNLFQLFWGHINLGTYKFARYVTMRVLEKRI